MEKTVNTCCPFCGSNKMTADITVTISGDLTPKGEIVARDYWTPKNLTEESIACAPSQNIKGYCEACGAYCDFDWQKGYVK